MVDPMTKTKRELVRMLTSLEDEKSILKNEIDDLQTLNADTMIQFCVLYQFIKELQEKKNEQEKENHAAKERVKLLQEQNNSILEKMEMEHASFIRKLKNEMEKITQKNEFLNKENQRLIVEKETLTEERNAIMNKMENFNGKLEKITDGYAILKEKNENLTVENMNQRACIKFLKAFSGTENEMFLLLDDNLEVKFSSHMLMQQLKDDLQREETPSFLDMISGIEPKKYHDKMYKVINHGKKAKFKKIYLNRTQASPMKVKGKLFPVTYECKPAVKVILKSCS